MGDFEKVLVKITFEGIVSHFVKSVRSKTSYLYIHMI